MAYFKNRALRWVAPLAIVGAVGLAACGDEDAGDSTRTAGVAGVAAAASGSDRHLENQADSIASSVRGRLADSERLTAEAEAYENRTTPAAIVVGSDVHLTNQSADIAERSAPEGSDVHLTNQSADIAERQDKLDNAAETYGQETAPEPSNDEFVPGTRRMPVR